MGEKKINRLPVVDKKFNLLGLVTRGDVIGTLV
jgi:CBS domain-containing protein